MAAVRTLSKDRANRCAIAIMAKAPDAGRVKTRLLPVLAPEEATELSCCFLRDMTQMLAEAGRAAPVDGHIAFAPAGSEASFASIVAPGTGFVLADGLIDAPPGVEGFGRCLLQAARGLFDLGYGAVGLLNSDSPTMPADLMIEAARLLTQAGDRVVLGPASDGGYYLLGLNGPHVPDLFTGVRWSTTYALMDTLRRCEFESRRVTFLPLLHDVDEPADLTRLAEHLASTPDAAPHTAAALAALGVTR